MPVLSWSHKTKRKLAGSAQLHCAPEKYKIPVSTGSLGPLNSSTTYEKDSGDDDRNGALIWSKTNLSVGVIFPFKTSCPKYVLCTNWGKTVLCKIISILGPHLWLLLHKQEKMKVIPIKLRIQDYTPA